MKPCPKCNGELKVTNRKGVTYIACSYCDYNDTITYIKKERD